MAHYIDKDAVLAEIDEVMAEEMKFYETACKEGDEEVSSSPMVYTRLQILRSYINTLEVKEANNIWYDVRKTIPEDSTEQIICVKEDGLAIVTVGKIANGTVKWSYLNNLLKPSNTEVKDVDLEKEIELVKGDYEQVDVAWNNDFDFIARHFFGIGLSNQLTWQDIELIAKIGMDFMNSEDSDNLNDEEYYTEILNRFKTQKGE